MLGQNNPRARIIVNHAKVEEVALAAHEALSRFA